MTDEQITIVLTHTEIREHGSRIRQALTDRGLDVSTMTAKEVTGGVEYSGYRNRAVRKDEAGR